GPVISFAAWNGPLPWRTSGRAQPRRRGPTIRECAAMVTDSERTIKADPAARRKLEVWRLSAILVRQAANPDLIATRSGWAEEIAQHVIVQPRRRLGVQQQEQPNQDAYQLDQPGRPGQCAVDAARQAMT